PGSVSMATRRVVQVYLDLLSQPCRAVQILLSCTNIPHTVRTVALRRGEHRTPEFTKLNPMQRVPVLKDNDFILTESDAILKYLATKYDVPEHWYPRQPERRARVGRIHGLASQQHTTHAAKVFILEPDIGVDDAVIYLLHTSLTHLEKAGSTVRIMFFDFSSAFNTIQPRLLGDKLQLAGVDHHLTTWILDYLTHRPQFVRVQGFESDRLLCSTGAPHRRNGSGSFPVHPLHCRLFIQYSIHVISRSSLMTLLLLASSQMGTTESTEDLFRTLRTGACGTTSRSTPVKPRSWWWISSRRSHSPPAPVSIQGTDIDTVKSYKYLGVHLNDNLDWTHNTDALVKKGNSRLFLLRRLRSFGVQGPLLRTFYDSVVASAIFYGIVCWASSITDRDRRRNGQTGHSDSSGQLLQQILSLYCVQVLLPTQSGSRVDEEHLIRALAQLDDTLDKLESMFLRRQPFLCGDDITVADLLAVCELMQPLGGGRDVLEQRPQLQRWRSRVQSAVGKSFDRAHSVLYAVRDRRKAKL
ncbi:hypothetical protein L3Q82_023462, partial [Scortum barcoo]